MTAVLHQKTHLHKIAQLDIYKTMNVKYISGLCES